MTSQPKTPAILNDNISRKIPDGSRISYYREFLNARFEGFSLKKGPGKYCAPRVHHRRLPFNQNFRNFRNSGKRYRNFPEKFQKPGKRLNFRNANHSTEISGNFHVQSCTEKKLPGKFFENLSIPRDVVLFYGNF